MKSLAPRLLAIDDDPFVLELIQQVANGCGYDVLVTSDSRSAIHALETFQPAVVLSDLVMPAVDGVELLRIMAQAKCTASISILSHADAKTIQAAVRLGQEYGLDMLQSLAKPFDMEALGQLLQRARWDRREVPPEELLQAMADRQLEVFYQPKVSIESEGVRIIGAEALVRWRHPRRGLLTANRFVPTAEQAGLIEPLSSWVLSSVIAQLAKWEEARLDLSAAVNLPASFFDDVEFPDRIENALREAGVPATRLILEITERAAIQNESRAIDVLTRLRLKGVGLSIDDFGVGHSSLIELYRMPFTELKIDASFTQDLEVSPQARTIVRSLVEMAAQLGIETCAEGVESQGLEDELRIAGCNKAQGFLYGAAQTAADFEALFAANAAPKRAARAND